MDLSEPQCSSSGCESGWTLYLDQSSWSKNHQYQGFAGRVEEGDKEQEDLSMVSDASSGPPHYIVDDAYGGGGGEEDCFGHQVTRNNKMKSKECCYYLDDTATSPAFNSKPSRNDASIKQVPGISQDFAGKKTKGSSSLKKHFGFLQPSFPEKSASKQPGGFQGRKWK